MIVEQVVTLQSQKVASDCAFSQTSNPANGNLRIVIADANRNAAKEFERSLVAFQKRFRTFARKGLHENGIRIWQRHHKQRHLRELAFQPHIGIAKVHLGFTRRMRQR